MRRKFHPLNWIQWLTLLSTVVLLVTVPLIFIQIENVQHHQNDALHSIICRAEHVVKTQPGIPDKQRREALHFYENALEGAHLEPCE